MESILKENEKKMKMEEDRKRKKKERYENNKSNDPYGMEMIIEELFM